MLLFFNEMLHINKTNAIPLEAITFICQMVFVFIGTSLTGSTVKSLCKVNGKPS